MSEASDTTTALSPGPQGMGSPLDKPACSVYSMPAEDLSSESLLKYAPRVQFNSLTVPCLGGIPLLAKLGQGGMGAVYFGIHTRLMVEVAVKVLPFQMADQDPTAVQRFYREAQIAAKVKSRRLVSVMDVNQDAGLFYLVMEFVDGLTAGAYARKCITEDKLAGAEETTALDICIAACEGLAAAHAEGVIHRDIKPENLLIPRDKATCELRFSEAKLADLGLARQDSTIQSLTAAQNIMGTPGFMSPEQANDSRNALKPSDVFSMGATLYALLCGHAPFSGDTTLESILNTIQKPHRPITQYRRDLSFETVTLIDRCLCKSQGRRHGDAAALLTALQECRARVGRGARGSGKGLSPAARQMEETLEPQAVPALPAAASSAGASRISSRRQPAVRSSASGSLLLLLLGAALLVGGGLWLAQDREERERERSAEDARQRQSAAADARDKQTEAEEATRRERESADRNFQAQLQAKIDKALQDAQAAKSQPGDAAPKPPADISDPVHDTAHSAPSREVQTPPTDAPAATSGNSSERVQRLLKKLNAANDDVERAAKEQQRAVEQANALNQKHTAAAANVERLRQDLDNARKNMIRARDAANQNRKLSDDAAQAVTDFHAAEDALTAGQEELVRTDKEWTASMAAYTKAGADVARILEQREKLEHETKKAAIDANIVIQGLTK